MLKKLGNFIKIVLLTLVIAAQPLTLSVVSAHGDSHEDNFVRRDGSKLTLNGKEFRFGGTNNYYLMYMSQFMVDDVIDTAAAQGFTVLRTWGNLEIGNQDGSNSINGKSNGVYFQYWNGTAPAYNDGADGMQKLDYVIYKAGQKGLKLIIPFTNNWNAFGSADQYVRWANGQYHDQFYTDPVIEGWFKNWISHLLNRVNTYTGIQYKNDPTIMTWELVNEPRCKYTDAYPTSGNCTTKTLVKWADEISTYTKKIDKNHLVSVGDEGFYCNPKSTDWKENCGEGDDVIAFTKLKNIDVMSYHLYPELWGTDIAWGTEWIKRHTEDARKIGKPAMLGEFGITDKNTRNPVYRKWTDTILKSDATGALFWMLAGKQDGAGVYPDYDGHNIYCPGPECITLSNFAAQMATKRDLKFPPVAGNDSVTTEADTAVTLNLLANDTTYDTKLVPASVDLDPAVAGIQTTQSAYGGAYVSHADGTLTFTPTAGFNGKSQISYTVKDKRGRLSNAATVIITVKPSPTGATTLYSFEFGVDNWGPASWDPHGTVAQSTTSATEGTHSLQINSTGGWFAVEPSPAADYTTGGQYLRFEINSSVATSIKLSICTGSSWNWQESGNIALSVGDNIVGVDPLAGIGGGALVDANQVRRLAIYLAPGVYYLDNVRLDHVAPPPPPPPPSNDVMLYSFESGVQGWAAVSWDPQGTVAQSADFHTDGANSLQVTTTGSGWFGVGLPVAADFTGKTNLKFDLQTTTIGTSLSVVLQTGNAWTWCQSPWTSVNAGTTTAVDIDLLTLADSSGNTCNKADLNQVHAIYVFLNGGGAFNIDNVRVAGTVVVAPAALYSFEGGVEGWGPASWDPQGTVAQSADFHTDGANSLQVVTTGDGWFGLDMPAAADLTGKTHLKFDFQTMTAGTSMNVAVKIGSGWTWCQGAWGWVNAGTATTVDLDLQTLTDSSGNACNVADLNQTHSIYVFLNGGGAFYIDNVRGE
jgi:mannan endo-1,4-beta-mannosidase